MYAVAAPEMCRGAPQTAVASVWRSRATADELRDRNERIVADAGPWRGSVDDEADSFAVRVGRYDKRHVTVSRWQR